MVNATSIKTIAVDLDRTLLHTDKTLSAHTVKVFETCKKCGMKIIVATARPFRDAKQYCEIIDADAIVVSNGARIIYGINAPLSIVVTLSGIIIEDMISSLKASALITLTGISS